MSQTCNRCGTHQSRRWFGETIRVEKGGSGGSTTISKSGIRYNTGRTYYRTERVSICENCKRNQTIFRGAIAVLAVAAFGAMQFFPRAAPPVETALQVEQISAPRSLPPTAEAAHDDSDLGVVYTVEAGGVRVTSVRPDGLGAHLGLVAGDLITRVNSVDVRQPKDIESGLSEVLHGGPRIWVDRGGTIVGLDRDALADVGRSSPSINGVWQGSYECERDGGSRVMVVALQLTEADNAVSATFQFQPAPGEAGGPSGVFTLAGSYDPQSRRLTLRPLEWVRRDGDWSMSTVSGHFDSSFQQLTGETTFRRCGDFTAAKFSER